MPGETQPNPPKRKPRVLIVDDSQDSLKIESSLFRACGADVATAPGGDTAITSFREQSAAGTPFDLVILDIHMPEPNGYDVAKTLRADGFKGSIVAFTAYVAMKFKNESESSGIDRYLSKTVLRKELIEALLREHCHDLFTS